MLEEKYEVINIEIDPQSKVIQVRGKKEILNNGTIIATTYIDHTVQPGDSYVAEYESVKTIASIVHTPEVVADFKAKQELEAAKILNMQKGVI